MREYLNKKVKVIIDRPLCSKHPKHEIYYPLNYGYIPNTTSGDGVVSKDSYKYSKEQIEALIEFQERFFDSEIIMG